MRFPAIINGRFFPNFPLVRSTTKPMNGSVTPSQIRMIMEKLPASTTPRPTQPVMK